MRIVTRNLVNALSPEAVRHIKEEAYAEAGEDIGLFRTKCVEIAFDFPHYAKAVEISKSFNLNYHFVRFVIYAQIAHARTQRDEQYERENV